MLNQIGIVREHRKKKLIHKTVGLIIIATLDVAMQFEGAKWVVDLYRT